MDSSEAGLKARAIAQDPLKAKDYVLKPNRDGGGHNIYRAEIPVWLTAQPDNSWQNHVLMRLIELPSTIGTLMTAEDLYRGEVVSELGILGTCLWKRNESQGAEIIANEAAGWTFKMKPKHVDEMSVVKGYGSFDYPWLVEV